MNTKQLFKMIVPLVTIAVVMVSCMPTRNVRIYDPYPQPRNRPVVIVQGNNGGGRNNSVIVVRQRNNRRWDNGCDSRGRGRGYGNSRGRGRGNCRRW
jgi:hypothetical protein